MVIDGYTYGLLIPMLVGIWGPEKNYRKSPFLGLKVPGTNPILYRSLTVLNFGSVSSGEPEIEDGETPI